jgi:hypothetical protein
MTYGPRPSGPFSFIDQHFIPSDTAIKPFCDSKTGFLTPGKMPSALVRVPHRFAPERRQSIAACHFSFSHLPPSEHQPGSGMGNLSHAILSRIVRNNSRGIDTSAIWKITSWGQITRPC